MARHSPLWATGFAICLLALTNTANGKFLGFDLDVDFWFWQTGTSSIDTSSTIHLLNTHSRRGEELRLP